MKCILLLLCCIYLLPVYAQDTAFVKVHFLYGSKPKHKFREVEPAWFGGILGGHVGIESNNGEIVNFVPNGKFHWFAKNKNPHSTWTIHNPGNFYSILGGHPDSVKKVIIVIPVTAQQKQLFDSITAVYLQQTPYDYTLFGMRCAAASYDVLAQAGIVKQYSYKKNCLKIFYPKKLRKRLLKKAKQNGWMVIREDGSERRKWEKD